MYVTPKNTDKNAHRSIFGNSFRLEKNQVSAGVVFVNRLLALQMMEYYTATKTNELQLIRATGLSLIHIILSKRNQAKRLHNTHIQKTQAKLSYGVRSHDRAYAW